MKYEDEINRWVEKVKRSNTRVLHRIAESQLALESANKNIARYRIWRTGPPMVTLQASSYSALDVLQVALSRMFPGKDFDVIGDNYASLNPKLDDKRTCHFCGAMVKVPCNEPRSRSCKNRERRR